MAEGLGRSASSTTEHPARPLGSSTSCSWKRSQGSALPGVPCKECGRERGSRPGGLSAHDAARQRPPDPQPPGLPLPGCLERVADRGRRDGRTIPTSGWAVGTESRPDGAAGPLERLIWRQRLERVYRAINELPKRCRRALILHRRDGWTYDEIAADLEVSRSMVTKYLRKALVLCRHALANDEASTSETSP